MSVSIRLHWGLAIAWLVVFVGLILAGFAPAWFQAVGFAILAVLMLSFTYRAAQADADQKWGKRP